MVSDWKSSHRGIGWLAMQGVPKITCLWTDFLERCWQKYDRDLKSAIPSPCRSQWPRGLRRRSSAARLLRLWVRIPPGAWMFVYLSVVSVVCCQVEVSARG